MNVAIAGVGQTKVGEHWGLSLREMSLQAIEGALDEAGNPKVEALFVGNMLAGLGGQLHLGPLIADYVGIVPKEAVRVEATCASGGAAFRSALHFVQATGKAALVCGVEKMTDVPPREATRELVTAADAELEGVHGPSFPALNALLMRRYMHEFHCRVEDFALFPVNAHKNAMHCEWAMYHRPITAQDVCESKSISSPIRLLDCSPRSDGSASAVLVPQAQGIDTPVTVVGSAAATDTLTLAGRRDLLTLDAARESARLAYEMAHLGPGDIDVFELHDAFSIIAVLSLEAAGFAPRGGGVTLAMEGEIAPGGRIPICTFGGLKARGHPIGATGVYQIVELVKQLRGDGGGNQVPAEVGMAQSIGGVGGTAITHILARGD